MKTQSTFQRTLQALLISGISVFAVVPAYAADPVRVTANNDVRAESDFQMKGYIEKLNNFGSGVIWNRPGTRMHSNMLDTHGGGWFRIAICSV